MRWRGRLMDAGVAGLTFAATLGLIAAGGFGTPDPHHHRLDVAGVLLVAASSVPLAVRRVLPTVCYLVTASASGLLLHLGYPLDVPFGALVAAYALALAYSGHPSALRRQVALFLVAVYVPLLTVDAAFNGYSVWDMAPGLLAWFAVFVGLFLAGDRTRLRHERIAALEERSRRAERDAERERRLAAAEERTRIARELHDSAGHAINVILVQAGAARLLHERDPEGSRRAVTTIEQVARETIGEIDRMVRALRDDGGPEPPAPPDPSTLGELVERYRAGGLDIATEVDGPRRALPGSLAWAAYRILQEALTNAARHGRGSADVAVWFGLDAVRITVTNPVGQVGGDAPAGGGHGIVGMRERASLLGGTLHAGTDNGSFRLQARLPHSDAARVEEARDDADRRAAERDQRRSPGAPADSTVRRGAEGEVVEPRGVSVDPAARLGVPDESAVRWGAEREVVESRGVHGTTAERNGRGGEPVLRCPTDEAARPQGVPSGPVP